MSDGKMRAPPRALAISDAQNIEPTSSSAVSPSSLSSIPTVPDAVRAAIARMRADRVVPNPCVDLVEERTLRWAIDLGLVDGEREERRFARIRCGSCAAHTYPRAHVDVIELGAELIGWLFLFDDRYGEGRDLTLMVNVFEGCLELLRTGRLPPRPLPCHRALADLRRRLGAIGGASWLARFAESLSKYLSGCMFEFPYRQVHKPPTLNAYRRIRTWSIGTFPVFDLIDLAVGAPLRPATPRMDLLRDYSAMLCAWVNDVHSYAKEVQNRDPLNLVTVLEHERGGGLIDALDAAVAVYHADLDRLQAECAALATLPDATQTDREVARGLLDWVYGNYSWTYLCGRYYPGRSGQE